PADFRDVQKIIELPVKPKPSPLSTKNPEFEGSYYTSRSCQAQFILRLKEIDIFMMKNRFAFEIYRFCMGITKHSFNGRRNVCNFPRGIHHHHHIGAVFYDCTKSLFIRLELTFQIHLLFLKSTPLAELFQNQG